MNRQVENITRAPQKGKRDAEGFPAGRMRERGRAGCRGTRNREARGGVLPLLPVAAAGEAGKVGREGQEDMEGRL